MIKKKVARLYELVSIFTQLKSRLNFTLAPPLQLLSQLSLKKGGECEALVLDAIAKCKVGGFKSGWSKSVSEFNGISAEERSLLLELGDILGAFDAATQTRGLELLIEKAQFELNRAREESEKNGRLYITLGALCGTAVTVLVL